MRLRPLFALLAAIVTSPCIVDAGPISGTSALAGESPTTTATLVAVPDAHDPLVERLTIAFRTIAHGAPIRRFDLDLTKRMHLVIVRDDLASFAHVHPALHADGRFTLEQRFPTSALYHLYADVTPHGLGHQVQRFDLAVGGGRSPGTRDLRSTGARVRVGPYAVILDRIRLRAGRENRIVAHVLRGTSPARDLRPYLGARAHAVLLDAATLDYLHVHPEGVGAAAMSAMGAMTMPTLADDATVDPDMILHVTPKRTGVYKLWLQFRAGSSVYVAPFVLRAD